jgi:hypothetical protein
VRGARHSLVARYQADRGVEAPVLGRTARAMVQSPCTKASGIS